MKTTNDVLLIFEPQPENILEADGKAREVCGFGEEELVANVTHKHGYVAAAKGFCWKGITFPDETLHCSF